MDDESADDRDTERRGDDAPPLPADFSSLLAAAGLFCSASEAAVNGSLGRDDSACCPLFVCRLPMMGVCERSYVNSIVRPTRFTLDLGHERKINDKEIPGSSFLTKSSLSENEEVAESEPQPELGPLVDDGGATREEDLVTDSFKIFKASFQ